MTLIEKAKAFAEKVHAGQNYGGDRPYTYHLAAVVQEAEHFRLPEEVVAAAWLHDTMEDTNTTRDELINEFGEEVARLVWAVTDYDGKNRKERAQKTLPKTRIAGEEAIALKLCDRIANVRACVDGVGNTDLLKMYKKEYPFFREALKKHTLELRPSWNFYMYGLWAALDILLEYEEETT